jgi:peptidoglycan L-alanyl-D-glutamate endopeptidase CwlK
MTTLKKGLSGPEVRKLQEELKARGFSPGSIDEDFGGGTEAAVIAFQNSEGLLADGIAGPRTLERLGLAESAGLPVAIPSATIAVVSQMFPHTKIDNIKTNLPKVLDALAERNLGDKPMVLMALATIRAETASFMPIAEGQSRFNTSPGGAAFDLYDNRKDLGNRGKPDGARFCGRGFIQLTGRANYERLGAVIGLGNQLIENPERASDPVIAAKLLAAFLAAKELAIKQALLAGDLKTARKLVNGGSHGLDAFSDAYAIGDRLIA